MKEIGPQRRKLGESIWLYLLLIVHATQAEGPWWPVCASAPISDERLAVFLDVAAPTVREWRQKLERAGFVRSEPSGLPLHRRFWVAVNLNPLEHGSPQDLQLPLSRLVH